ncbi:MAG: hypothetical protein C0169_05575, partial [Thermodesulfobacterium geofontis]
MEKIDIIKKNLKKVVEEKIQKMPIYSWIDSFYDIFISWEEFFEILKKYDDKALFNISEFSGEDLKNIEEEVVKISIEGLKCRIRKEIEKELQSV